MKGLNYFDDFNLMIYRNGTYLDNGIIGYADGRKCPDPNVIFQFFCLRQFLEMFELIKAFGAPLNICKNKNYKDKIKKFYPAIS